MRDIDLAKLYRQIDILLNLYYHKDKWHHITPLLANLSEQVVTLFNREPHRALASIQLQSHQHSYTVRLVVNQLLIANSLCRAFNLSAQSQQQLSSLVLCQYLCVNKEIVRQAAGHTLNNEQRKLVKFKLHYAQKLIARYGSSQKYIQQALKELVDNQFSLYQSDTRLVTLSSKLATLITASSTRKPHTLFSAAQLIYHSASCKRVKTDLRYLFSKLPEPLSGSILAINGEPHVHIEQLAESKYLLFKLTHKKLSLQGRFVLKDKLPNQCPRPVCQTSPEFISKLIMSGTDHFKDKHAQALNLNQHSDSSDKPDVFVASDNIEKIELYLSSNSGIKQRLLERVSDATTNKTVITSTSHAIRFLGIVRTSEFIERESAIQTLATINHINWRHFIDRTRFLLDVIDLVCEQTGYHTSSLPVEVLKALANIVAQTPNLTISHPATHVKRAHPLLFTQNVTQTHDLKNSSIEQFTNNLLSDTGHAASSSQESILQLAYLTLEYIFDPNDSRLNKLSIFIRQLNLSIDTSNYLNAITELSPKNRL